MTVFVPNLSQPGRALPVIGSGLMVVMAVLLVVAALVIGYDGFLAFRRYRAQPAMAVPATAGCGKLRP